MALTHHEMWRDELEAWIVAKDSLSLPMLLENLEYIGHPALWYLCLYFLNQITSNPTIMQVWHLLIATTSFGIFLFGSPFKLIHKILYGFGYYSLFEYGILSRSYSLGILLLFLACVLVSNNKRNYQKTCVVLALAAQTNAFALMIFFALLFRISII